MVRLRLPTSLGVLILAILLFITNYFFDLSFAQHPLLEYFPVNERIVNKSTDGLSGYPKVKNEIVCNVSGLTWGNNGADAEESLITCLTWIGWKAGCKDCCINYTAGAPADAKYRCTKTPTDPLTGDECKILPFADSCGGGSRVDCFDCNASTFTCTPRNNDCSASSPILNCQIDGCPASAEPGPATAGAACKLHTDGFYYCTVDNLIPLDRGCVPEPLAQQPMGYNSSFENGTTTADFYTLTEFGPSPLPDICPADFSGAVDSSGTPITFDSATDSCWKYAGPFTDYVAVCRGTSSTHGYADEAELCQKQHYCCRKDVCQPEGMDASCDVSTDGGCEKILNALYTTPIPTIEVPVGEFQNPYEIKAHHCALLQEFVNNCVLNASSDASDCSACFEPIDDNFFYEFVPKSGESFVVLWTIDAEPQPMPAGMASDYNPYFYTMLRVTDESGETVALPSNIVHQKTFRDSFSINGAMAIDKALLNVGKKYYIKVYYYIPDAYIPAGAHLTMRVNRMELIAFRVRE